MSQIIIHHLSIYFEMGLQYHEYVLARYIMITLEYFN